MDPLPNGVLDPYNPYRGPAADLQQRAQNSSLINFFFCFWIEEATEVGCVRGFVVYILIMKQGWPYCVQYCIIGRDKTLFRDQPKNLGLSITFNFSLKAILSLISIALPFSTIALLGHI